jgi:hypothetical protein
VAQGAGRVVLGTVVDTAGKRPIESVEIAIDGAPRARSSKAGEFTLTKVGSGQHMISLRRIGYAPLVDTLRVQASDTIRVKYRMQSVGAPLPTVTVSTQGRFDVLFTSGFDERRNYGLGKFLTPDDWRGRHNATLADILSADVPAVYMTDGAAASRRGGISKSGPCYLSVWLDGVRSLPRRLDQISTADIAGIEVYRGPSEVPLQYGGTGAQCGVLLIWTGRR